MKRIKDHGENETMDNARAAFESYSYQKHKRDYVIKYENKLDDNLKAAVNGIRNET